MRGCFLDLNAIFFDGDRYIRVTRGDTGAGTVDAGYPKDMSTWGWPTGFGVDRIDAALFSGPKCYFFDGDRYIRVTRGDTGAGTVDAGYPAPISNWGGPLDSVGAGSMRRCFPVPSAISSTVTAISG
jgi:hypothetical protein